MKIKPEVGVVINGWKLTELQTKRVKNRLSHTWHAVCEACGRERTASASLLRSGGPTQCPCTTDRLPPLQPNDKVGEWTLLEYIPGKESDGIRIVARWRCQCSCGVIREVSTINLRQGQSKSCGHDHARLVAQHSKRNIRPVSSIFDIRFK